MEHAVREIHKDTGEPKVNTHGLTKGCRVTLLMPGNPLDGAAAKFIRQSEKTGSCLVELTEDHSTAWKKGDHTTINTTEMS